VAGMGDACRVFETPVTGGNVSFYNESPDSSVYPTPVIGMVGLIEDLKHITTVSFKNDGDLIYLVGKTFDDIGGSEFLKEYYGKVEGDCPRLNLDLENKIQKTVLETIRRGWIRSAHDVSDGGVAVALAECCIVDKNHPMGATINLKNDIIRPEWLLFSESQSRILLSISPENRETLEDFFSKQNVELLYIGRVGGNQLIINDWLNISLNELANSYFQLLKNKMES